MVRIIFGCDVFSKRNILLISEITGEPQTCKGDYKKDHQLLTEKDKLKWKKDCFVLHH